MFEILNNCLIRSHKLGNFEVEDFKDFSYWEIRFIFPQLINMGVTSLKDYFVKTYNVKNFDESQLFGFYYYILDELKEVSDFENQHLTFNSKSNTVHGLRAREMPALMEVHMLSGGCPVKKEKIKKMKYKHVFETLFAMSMDSEKKILKQP